MLAGMTSRLVGIGLLVRTFLEPHWSAWHEAWGPPQPTCLSQWTCVRSALFARLALRDLGLPAHFESGQPSAHGGYGFCRDGMWESHAWVVSAGSILDVTSDQFGGPDVFVGSADKGKYRPGDDSRSRLDGSAKAFAAVEVLWASWLSSGARQMGLKS